MSMLVTLKSLENGNSNIHIEVNTKGAEGDQRFVDRMIDTFLERLIKSKDDERRIASTGNKGCMVAILVMLGISLAASVTAAILF